MTKNDVKNSQKLMFDLFANYQAQSVEVWLKFFKSVPAIEVDKTIMLMSASGLKYAPELGEIYKKLKDGRPKKIADDQNPYYILALSGAKICDLDPPKSADAETVRKWFKEVFYACSDKT